MIIKTLLLKIISTNTDQAPAMLSFPEQLALYSQVDPYSFFLCSILSSELRWDQKIPSLNQILNAVISRLTHKITTATESAAQSASADSLEPIETDLTRIHRQQLIGFQELQIAITTLEAHAQRFATDFLARSKSVSSTPEPLQETTKQAAFILMPSQPALALRILIQLQTLQPRNREIQIAILELRFDIFMEFPLEDIDANSRDINASLACFIEFFSDLEREDLLTILQRIQLIANNSAPESRSLITLKDRILVFMQECCKSTKSVKAAQKSTFTAYCIKLAQTQFAHERYVECVQTVSLFLRTYQEKLPPEMTTALVASCEQRTTFVDQEATLTKLLPPQNADTLAHLCGTVATRIRDKRNRTRLFKKAQDLDPANGFRFQARYLASKHQHILSWSLFAHCASLSGQDNNLYFSVLLKDITATQKRAFPTEPLQGLLIFCQQSAIPLPKRYLIQITKMFEILILQTSEERLEELRLLLQRFSSIPLIYTHFIDSNLSAPLLIRARKIQPEALPTFQRASKFQLIYNCFIFAKSLQQPEHDFSWKDAIEFANTCFHLMKIHEGILAIQNASKSNPPEPFRKEAAKTLCSLGVKLLEDPLLPQTTAIKIFHAAEQFASTRYKILQISRGFILRDDLDNAEFYLRRYFLTIFTNPPEPEVALDDDCNSVIRSIRTLLHDILSKGVSSIEQFRIVLLQKYLDTLNNSSDTLSVNPLSSKSLDTIGFVIQSEISTLNFTELPSLIPRIETEFPDHEIYPQQLCTGMGMYYSWIGNLERSQALLKQAFTLDNQKETFHIANLGISMFLCCRFQEAYQYFVTAFKTAGPENYSFSDIIFVYFSITCFMLQKYQEAATNFNSVFIKTESSASPRSVAASRFLAEGQADLSELEPLFSTNAKTTERVNEILFFRLLQASIARNPNKSEAVGDLASF
jgi:tetratricopeptide (TPR) repeat protein